MCLRVDIPNVIFYATKMCKLINVLLFNVYLFSNVNKAVEMIRRDFSSINWKQLANVYFLKLSIRSSKKLASKYAINCDGDTSDNHTAVHLLYCH